MKLIYIPVLYFIAVILLAHFFTPPEYFWTQNTVSDLAAQGLKHQWIMQTGFIGFGLLINLAYLQKFRITHTIPFADVMIMLYGLSVLLTGFFSTAPFLSGVPYSAQESSLHSLFATTAGICFTAGILLRLMAAPTATERWLHAVFLLLVIAASLGFGLAENGTLPLGKGILQRALYLVSFVWLLISPG